MGWIWEIRCEATKGGADAVDCKMIQVALNGVNQGLAAERLNIQQDFSTKHCVLLRQFLSSDVKRHVRGLLRDRNYYTRVDHNTDGTMFARESTLSADHPLANYMFMLLNQPALFRLMAELTQYEGQFNFFRSRVYEFAPKPEHFDSWHDDDEKDQIVGLSINLNPEPLEGGEFEIRDCETGEITCRVEGTAFGDAHFFRIGNKFDHRVLPVTGENPRISCAGWFCPKPNYRDEIAKMFQNVVSPMPRGDDPTGKP